MNDFPTFSQAVEAQFALLSQHELYVVDSDRDAIWDHYLNSFPEGTNPIFRKRTEHDCSCCKNFIRNVGNVIAIIDGVIHTVWDVAGVDHPYDTVAASMAQYVRGLPIRSVFRTSEYQFGAAVTPEYTENGTINWHHFLGKIASRHRCSDAASTRSRFESAAGVLKRGLEELTPAALTEVSELIGANALYRGQEHAGAVTAFRKLKQEYDRTDNKELFIWDRAGLGVARFRNSVIGTLVQDLSNGEELEKAVKAFETKVAPENYKRPTALITPRMIDAAVATLKDLDLEDAIERRFARIEDVSVNNVLFVDNSIQEQMRDGIAGLLMEEVKPQKVNLDNATDISIDDFMANVLTASTALNLLVENKHLGNFMSLTAPAGEGGKSLFKWDNDFAWTYDGDIADSVKQRVKAAGGRVDAKFRVSLGWYNYDDLDIHVYEPGGNHIYYGNRCGKLDVDMNVHANGSREAVENVCWDRLRNGTYIVEVNNYTLRESIDVGFELDVEFDGVQHKFHYPKKVRGTVKALAFKVQGGKVVEIKTVAPGMVGGTVSQEKWGITTESLVPVDTLMLSPNHWDGQTVGNKHWFFILKDCKNPDPARGIYNEFLNSRLEEHRKVFEVLGSKAKCPPAEDQLSGVGFSSTRGDTVKVVADNRAFNIQF